MVMDSVWEKAKVEINTNNNTEKKITLLRMTSSSLIFAYLILDNIIYNSYILV
jgi:hypothetical protein